MPPEPLPWSMAAPLIAVFCAVAWVVIMGAIWWFFA
jgi:hypothetical protein